MIIFNLQPVTYARKMYFVFLKNVHFGYSHKNVRHRSLATVQTLIGNNYLSPCAKRCLWNYLYLYKTDAFTKANFIFVLIIVRESLPSPQPLKSRLLATLNIQFGTLIINMLISNYIRIHIEWVLTTLFDVYDIDINHTLCYRLQTFTAIRQIICYHSLFLKCAYL